MGLVILKNLGKRGAVDIDLPDGGRTVEMAVRRAKASEKDANARETFTRIVKVTRPASISLAAGESSLPLNDKILRDPVVTCRIRNGILGVRKYVPRAAMPEEKKSAEQELPKGGAAGKGVKDKGPSKGTK